jgi:serine/threonine-protein kinase
MNMAGVDEKRMSARRETRMVGSAGDPYIGRTFGERYEILSKIGEGAQARVYLARHVLIDRLVAVKFLLPILAADKTLVARFLNEGRAAGALGHANIVESLDVGFAEDGAPYLVLELLNGRTLAEEIAHARALPPTRAAYIACQIASALSAAHAREIIHRDLKPANVLLVERNGRPDHVKVVDFGVSKFTTGGSRVSTITGQPLGTPGFMAPEQIEDPQNIDSRADVYGLGATLFDMLAGEPPFADVGFPKVLRLIVEEEPRKLGELRPDLPVGLVNIVERAMSKSPAARFRTMTDFENALLPFAEEPVRFRSADRFAPPPVSSNAPASVSMAAASASAYGVGPAQSPPDVAKRTRKRRLALAALLLLFVSAVSLWFTGKPSPQPVTEVLPVRHAEPASAALTPGTAPAPNPVSATEVPAPPATVATASNATEHTSRAHEKWTAHAASRTAAHTDVPAQSAEPLNNCNPPFYFEGKKKLFKTGCI